MFSNTKPPYVHKNLSEQLGVRLPNLDIFLLSAWTGFEGGEVSVVEPHNTLAPTDLTLRSVFRPYGRVNQ